jgi:hypothetical protein
MRIKALLSGIAMLAASGLAFADLEPWTDYEVSDAVWSVTTVKVDSNMGDAYLEGLRETWISGNKISQELGQIESWSIFRSVLPESGDFNLILVVKFANTADLAPNKARYEQFMAKFTKEQSDRTTEYAQKNYPGMREITGEYWMREVTVK